MRFQRIIFLALLFMASGTWAMNKEDRAQVLPILSESMTASEWKKFAKIGCGYYPIPEHIKGNLPKTLELARSLNACCKGQLGYSSEEKQQIEIKFLEKKDWGNFPAETVSLAEEMTRIGQSIVVNVLKALEVDASLYPQSTGGLSDGRGRSYFKLAHYDATKNYPALPWHKDIRWVTVLFINQEGLQGQVNNNVIDVKPLEGYFVVNLGVFFEAFINDSEKLKAFVHQVQQVKKDRSSFGAFCAGDYSEKGFYQLYGGSLVWQKPEAMNAFLIEDKSFSIGAHAIFGDRS